MILASGVQWDIRCQPEDHVNDEDEIAQAEQGEIDRLVPIRLVGVDAIEAKYANVVHVNFDRAAFQIILSQFLQPVILSPEDARDLAQKGFAPATVVGKFVFTPLMMEQTINLLQRQLDAYRSKRGDGETKATEAVDE